ncbi:MAG TPA: cell division protein ZapA [Pyrinomonadaceae bacterium]
MSDSDIDSVLTEPVEVTIFNQIYRLRSKAGREHLEQVARLVDERMRQISSQTTTYDLLKIAVLTALNIADEMQNLRSYYEKEIEPLLAKLSGSEAAAGKGPSIPGEPESNSSPTWFEDFFEAKVETKDRAERLSSQVSAKLKSLRQPGSDQLGITSEEDDTPKF